jgi:Tetratricopeptide repeat
LGESGLVTAAIDYWTQLATAATEHLGPDHPHTLDTRHNLAYWRGEAGDSAGAAEAFGQLLTDCLRVLGPDHPHTLTTRHNLTYWRRVADGS